MAADEDDDYVSCGLTVRELLDMWGPDSGYRAEVVRIDGVVAYNGWTQDLQWVLSGAIVKRGVTLSVWRRGWTRDDQLRLILPPFGGLEALEPWPDGSILSVDVLLHENERTGIVFGVARATLDVGAFADEVNAITSPPGQIEDPSFGVFTSSLGDRCRYWGEVVFQGEDVDVEFVVPHGELPTSLPSRVRWVLVRLPELFNKSRATLRRWLSQEEQCHVVDEDIWLDVSLAMDNLALDSLTIEENGECSLSFFIYEEGGWYYEPGDLFVVLGEGGSMVLDAY